MPGFYAATRSKPDGLPDCPVLWGRLFLCYIRIAMRNAPTHLFETDLDRAHAACLGGSVTLSLQCLTCLRRERFEASSPIGLPAVASGRANA